VDRGIVVKRPSCWWLARLEWLHLALFYAFTHQLCLCVIRFYFIVHGSTENRDDLVAYMSFLYGQAASSPASNDPALRSPQQQGQPQQQQQGQSQRFQYQPHAYQHEQRGNGRAFLKKKTGMSSSTDPLYLKARTASQIKEFVKGPGAVPTGIYMCI
jgi:hypothetical protein